MGSQTRIVLAGILAIAMGGAIGASPAHAQSAGSSGSLGGYGAASNFATPDMGGGGALVIPYGGMYEGFMPSRMGGGSTLALRSRPDAAMGYSRTSFRLAPMSGGMGQGSPMRPRGLSTFGSGGAMGLGGGMSRMPGAVGASVMPPNFGYPFRQPPSLLAPSTTGMGMSM